MFEEKNDGIFSGQIDRAKWWYKCSKYVERKKAC